MRRHAARSDVASSSSRPANRLAGTGMLTAVTIPTPVATVLPTAQIPMSFSSRSHARPVALDLLQLGQQHVEAGDRVAGEPAQPGRQELADLGLVEGGEQRLAVGRRVERERDADGRDRLQPLGAGDLVDEDHVVAREHGEVDGLLQPVESATSSEWIWATSHSRLALAICSSPGPRRKPAEAETGATKPSASSALTRRCTVERGRSTSAASSASEHPCGAVDRPAEDGRGAGDDLDAALGRPAGVAPVRRGPRHPARQLITIPPSTTNDCPLTPSAAGLAR